MHFSLSFLTLFTARLTAYASISLASYGRNSARSHQRWNLGQATGRNPKLTVTGIRSCTPLTSGFGCTTTMQAETISSPAMCANSQMPAKANGSRSLRLNLVWLLTVCTLLPLIKTGCRYQA
jgi:hypothetical protein